MSRLMTIIVSLIYVAGGLITGYYGYALKLKVDVANAGLDFDLVSQFVQSNYFAIGPILLIVAFLLHLSQILKARRIDRGHCEQERQLTSALDGNESKISALEKAAAENANVLRFCHDAIASASVKIDDEEINMPKKDYAK